MISFFKDLLLARGRKLVEKYLADNPGSDEIKLSPLHAPGRYFVDGNSCLWCDACSVEAPNNIAIDEKETFAYVFKQPTTARRKKKTVNVQWNIVRLRPFVMTATRLAM